MPLYLFVYFFEKKSNNFGWFIHAYGNKEWWGHASLIINTHKPVCFVLSPLHSNISKELHEKHLSNPSSHYGKYKKYAREMHAPYPDA